MISVNHFREEINTSKSSIPAATYDLCELETFTENKCTKL